MNKELTKTDDYRPARDCIGCKHFIPADYISIKVVNWVGLCKRSLTPSSHNMNKGFRLFEKYTNEPLKDGKALCYRK